MTVEGRRTRAAAQSSNTLWAQIQLDARCKTTHTHTNGRWCQSANRIKHISPCCDRNRRQRHVSPDPDRCFSPWVWICHNSPSTKHRAWRAFGPVPGGGAGPTEAHTPETTRGPKHSTRAHTRAYSTWLLASRGATLPFGKRNRSYFQLLDASGFIALWTDVHVTSSSQKVR